ncbi:MAG: DEAD/DEAH box helicase [Isosphaeraceae bacterium]
MLLSEPVRAWFESVFPEGPTPGQELAWPPIAAGENLLLVAPTGTGKTLAAFLAVLDRLFREREAGTLAPGLRCVYVSPLRSLNYDIERNLATPLDGIARRLELERSPIRVGVRTGDTSAYERRKLRDDPPHVLITTPESLALLLSQAAWQPHWKGVEHLIVDEVHALAPTKRGADLAVSLERLAAQAERDPRRIGLSATTRAEPAVVRFLAGASRDCRVIVAPPPPGTPPPRFDVESLIRPGEAPHRGLSYRRLLRRLRALIDSQRTTVVFANTRALAEKVTHDLRSGRSGVRSPMAEAPADPLPSPGSPGGSPSRARSLTMRRLRDGEAPAEPAPRPGSPSQEGDDSAADDLVIAAHHSALDVQRRRAIESGLRSGELRAVVTSTSLELGVDIGTADLAVQIGLPGGVSRCVQRVGRSGHRRGAAARGILLAATPAELVGAAVTARAAREGRLEPLRVPSTALDVVCQQLVGMACAGEQSVATAFDLIRRAGPMAELSREDFDACLAFLAGELGAPAGAYESEPGAEPRWTSPRIWRRNGWFGLRSGRVSRWFRLNVGTILSEESVRVVADGRAVGTLEAAYAERLAPGDRFVLDGRSLEVRRLEGSVVHARVSGGEPSLPRWTSDRQSLSSELAAELAGLRAEAARRLDQQGAAALAGWLAGEFALDRRDADVIVELVEAQERYSEVPSASGLLVEESPAPEGTGLAYAFHAPLHRSACEAIARATGARLGRRFGRNLTLAVADLGWSIRLPEGDRLSIDEIAPLVDPDRLDEDVLEGLDRGELPARRFRSVAATALMVLRNPEPGRRVRVGGMNWVSSRLYPLVQAACPDHPLLRQTRREVLEDFLDVPAAARWLASRPSIRFRGLPGISPFAAAWIEPGTPEAIQFESPGDALRRLHARLTAAAKGAVP